MLRPNNRDGKAPHKSITTLALSLVASLTLVPAVGVAGEYGGTLTVGQTCDLRAPRPTVVGQCQDLFYQQVYDTLVIQSAGGTIEPSLAESWEWNADKTRLRLKLRKGVKFHSGKELTSDIVVANIKNYQDPKTASKLGKGAKNITRMETPDTYTLDLYTDAFYPGMWHILGLLLMSDPDVFGQDSQWIGTGPFKFEEYIPGYRLVVVQE